MEKVKVAKLKGGEVLAKPILLDMGTVLICENTELKMDYIEKLAQLGVDYVYIKEKEIEQREVEQEEKSTIEEQVRQEYSEKVKDLLERHIHNNNEHIGELGAVATSIFDEVIEQKEVLDCVIEIHERSADLYEHSVSTCVLSVLTALKLGITPNVAKEIAIGSLLHDIGMRYIDVNSVDVELEDMSAYEAAEYKKHPVYGYSALEKEGWVSNTAKSLIISHHECIDGTGYPLHSRNNDEVRQILAVCDTFDSMICGIGHKRRKVHEAIEYIRYYAGTKYNKKVCDIFLEFIFLYPNGTRVLLNDGRVAKVMKQNKTLKERPVVCIEKTKEIVDMMKVRNIFIEKII